MRSGKDSLIMYIKEKRSREKDEGLQEDKYSDGDLIILKEMVDENPTIYLHELTLKIWNKKLVAIIIIAAFGSM